MHVLVCGAGGFIGHHLIKRLKQAGHTVVGVDLKPPAFSPSSADAFYYGDLRNPNEVSLVVDRPFDQIFQCAALMGGAGFIYSKGNDAEIMHSSMLINLNVLERARIAGVKKIFFCSSACVYPKHAQEDPTNPRCAEAMAYPADPDSNYGWEKLFAERVYQSYQESYSIKVCIARLHNVFGEEGAWIGGREKAPAALCRKVAMSQEGDQIEVWGDGLQTRSFLYIDECVEGILRLMSSGFSGPANLGSEEMITINELANRIIAISGKNLSLLNTSGPVGVMGRVSDNQLLREKLNWSPTLPLSFGLEKTYLWILDQVLRKGKGSTHSCSAFQSSDWVN